MKLISGTEAIQRMRQLRNIDDANFMLVHHTYNMAKGTTDGPRKVERCRLRPGLPNDCFPNTDPDLYLPYIDEEANKNGMCFKILMRYCAFPPNYEVLKIDWFKHEE